MGLFQKELYRLVLDVLETNTWSRDDDMLLYKNICIRLGVSLSEIPADVFLFTMMREKNLPDLQSVTRYRRMAQNKHIHLRGAKWAERRKIAEQLKMEMRDEFSTLKQEAV